jgi:hypothetical protein
LPNDFYGAAMATADEQFKMPDGSEYEVLEGRFDVVIDGEWRTLARGESATVPKRALHTFQEPLRGRGPGA